MADSDTPRPETDADLTPPPANAGFEPAEPLKDAGVAFEPDEAKPEAAAGVRQQLTDGAGKLSGQAGDQVRRFADMGKERAAGALEQLAAMLTDAAGQVDGKLGAQYGGYARQAAQTVQGFSAQVKDQDLDALLDSGRDLVRKSPAIAIGAAAALGFVFARLVQSGVDADRA